MIKMYSVYDRLADSYAQPFVMEPRTANRSFGWMKQETDPKDPMDKEVREIGDWDPETGSLIGHAPVAVFDLDPAKEDK